MKIYLSDLMKRHASGLSLSAFSLQENVDNADIIVSDESCVNDYSSCRKRPLILCKRKMSITKVPSSKNSTLIEYEDDHELEDLVKTEIITRMRDCSSLRSKYRQNIIPYFQEMVSISGDEAQRTFEILVRYAGEENEVIGAEHILSFLNADSALHIFKMLIEKINTKDSLDRFSFNVPISLINDDRACIDLKEEIDLQSNQSEKNIIIELTENFFESGINLKNLKAISESAALILIDDFGSDRANLDFYRSLSIDNLGIKIDMELFRSMSVRGVESFVAQAEGLLAILERSNLFVFEGVESQEQMACLEALSNKVGVKKIWGQGFALSIPFPTRKPRS